MATTTSGSGPRPAGIRWSTSRSFAGYLFASPALVILVVFSFVAIAVSLVLSFTNWTPLNQNWALVGLQNYKTAFGSERFWNAMRNTAQYVLLAVPGITITGLLLALIGNHARQLRSVFRTLYFIPTITPGVVVALIWIWMFLKNGGVNRILSIFGVDGPNWLFTRATAMPAIIMMSIWAAVGYYMIIFMAGLADIPQVYYEAAKVDGANRFQTFRHITLPLLRNPFIFVLVTLVINTWQVFTQMYIMTRGGPAGATESAQWEIYRNAFLRYDMGTASAMSWLLFAVIFLFTAIQLRVFISRQIY